MAYPTPPVMQFGMFGGGSGPGELFSLAAVARGRASVGPEFERMKGIG